MSASIYTTSWMEWTISVWMDRIGEWHYIATKGKKYLADRIEANNRIEAARRVVERLQDFTC